MRTPSVALPPAFQASKLISTAAGSALIAAVAGSVLGVALVSKPMVVGLLLALLLGILALIAAFARPGAAFVGLVLVLGLIPTYAAPDIGPLLFVPAAAASWLIAGGLAWRNSLVDGYPFRPTSIDYAAGVFALLMAISISFSGRVAFTDYIHLMFLWAGPYLAARLLLAETERPVRILALSFALVTVIVAPIAILEVLGSSNPFFALNFNGTEFAVWAHLANRFGEVRAETSFGHPIAFSMFLAASALLSLAMAITATKRNHQYVWYGLAAVAVGAQALALSRTGWLMIAIGVVLLALVMVRGSARRRLLTLVFIAATVVLVLALVLPKELQVLPGLENKSEHAFTGSGQYREALLERALQPGVLHLWGNPVNMVTPAVSGSTGTDNSYIILADEWGLIPTFALLGVGLASLLAVARVYRRRTAEATVILPILGFVCMVALFFVAFITQQQLMVWLLLGAASVALQRAGSAPNPSSELPD